MDLINRVIEDWHSLTLIGKTILVIGIVASAAVCFFDKEA